MRKIDRQVFKWLRRDARHHRLGIKRGWAWAARRFQLDFHRSQDDELEKMLAQSLAYQKMFGTLQ